MTASGGNLIGSEVNRKGASSMGSERPENCPVDSFQWRTGGSPGKRVATIEIAEHGDRTSLFTNHHIGRSPIFHICRRQIFHIGRSIGRYFTFQSNFIALKYFIDRFVYLNKTIRGWHSISFFAIRSASAPSQITPGSYRAVNASGPEIGQSLLYSVL